MLCSPWLGVAYLSNSPPSSTLQPLAVLNFFRHQALPVPGPLHLLFPWVKPSSPPTFIWTTPLILQVWINVNSSEMSSLFLMISLTPFSPSTLSFLSMERNEAFICLLIGLLSVSLITIALGGQWLCPFYLTFHIQQLSNSKLSNHIFYEWMTFCSFSNIIHSLAWCNLALFYFAVLLVCLTLDELR